MDYITFLSNDSLITTRRGNISNVHKHLLDFRPGHTSNLCLSLVEMKI